MNDSIELIKEDSLKFVEQYWNCANVYTCEKCPSKIGEQKPYEYYETFSCSGAMQIDLIERTIKVMENSIERTCKNLSSGSLFVCSECNGQVTQWNVTPNFCPNCGAKVVE